MDLRISRICENERFLLVMEGKDMRKIALRVFALGLVLVLSGCAGMSSEEPLPEVAPVEVSVEVPEYEETRMIPEEAAEEITMESDVAEATATEAPTAEEVLDPGASVVGDVIGFEDSAEDMEAEDTDSRSIPEDEAIEESGEEETPQEDADAAEEERPHEIFTDDTREYTYVLNANTKRIHYPTCPSVNQMKAKNRRYTDMTIEELEALGYVPCGNCKPR